MGPGFPGDRQPLNIILVSACALKITGNEFNAISLIYELIDLMQVRLFVFNKPFNIMREGFCNF